MSRSPRPQSPVSTAALIIFAVLVLGFVGYVFAGSKQPAHASRPIPVPTLAPWPKTTVAYIGDSYVAGYGVSDPSYRWSTLVTVAEGWAEANFGVPGSGYLRGGLQSGEHDQYINRIPAVAAAHPSIVVVAGGRNDTFGTDGGVAYRAAIVKFFTRLRAAVPGAKIIALPVEWDSSPEPPTITARAVFIRDACQSVHCTYLDIGNPLAGHPNWIKPHDIHPNLIGHQKYAAAVVRALAQAGIAHPLTAAEQQRYLYAPPSLAPS